MIWASKWCDRQASARDAVRHPACFPGFARGVCDDRGPGDAGNDRPRVLLAATTIRSYLRRRLSAQLEMGSPWSVSPRRQTPRSARVQERPDLVLGVDVEALPGGGSSRRAGSGDARRRQGDREILTSDDARLSGPPVFGSGCGRVSAQGIAESQPAWGSARRGGSGTHRGLVTRVVVVSVEAAVNGFLAAFGHAAIGMAIVASRGIRCGAVGEGTRPTRRESGGEVSDLSEEELQEQWDTRAPSAPARRRDGPMSGAGTGGRGSDRVRATLPGHPDGTREVKRDRDAASFV